jgi:outer membrane immunogenic protein
MKFLTPGVIAFALLPLTMTAHAASMALPTKAPPPAAAPIVASPDWSGFYLGVNGGGDDLIGGTLGYNYQTGLLVLGVEGDADTNWSSFGRSQYLDTVRGRIGIAFDQLLPYFTAGYAWERGDSGAAIGGGVEFRITPALSFKAEYLHLELVNQDDVVRIGLNWHFSLPAVGAFPIATRD